ncbi:hypothetical protein RRG08_067309 [Elysia crispata]|uniref:Uncharacterized protein n=1 Tax=Elysia crispata TaxID=231223 RepID=A0AAE1DCP4_9GAST|nr:hypothetical protein RRG08_067309 [Elysia crispata]
MRARGQERSSEGRERSRELAIKEFVSAVKGESHPAVKHCLARDDEVKGYCIREMDHPPPPQFLSPLGRGLSSSREDNSTKEGQDIKAQAESKMQWKSPSCYLQRQEDKRREDLVALYKRRTSRDLNVTDLSEVQQIES